MTRGRTRLYLSLDKLERTSWSYTFFFQIADKVLNSLFIDHNFIDHYTK